MKLLKTSFLLAAAASATQLDATDYRVEWSGATYGNSASAIAMVLRRMIFPSSRHSS
jgi:hypothetical protein